MNECVAAFLVLLFLGSGQTFLTHRSEEVGIDLSKNHRSSKPSPSTMPIEATNTAYVCLEVSKSLPPCNFDKVDYSMKEEETSDVSPSKSIKERKRKSYRRTIRDESSFIVYKLEGCLPSRLPFRLPLCKPNESFSSRAEVRILYPFRTQGEPETAPLIFPEINHNQWLRLMKNMGYHHESSTEDKRNLNFELEDVREERARPSRESEFINLIERKSKTPKKYISSKIHRQDDWSQFQNKEPHQEKMEFLEFRSMNEDMQNILYNAEKKIEEDAQQIRGLGQELDQLAADIEFPYSRAIPYNPEKLQVAREGSEFPYSKAIPFDARKLEVARKRSVLPSWKEIHYRSGGFGIESNLNELIFPNELSLEDNLLYPRISHHSRRLQSVGEDQEVFFDSSMLEAAKKGSIFPYSKKVPRDTSKKIQKNSESIKKNNQVKVNPDMENQEREKKTRVPRREIDNHEISIRHRVERLADDSGELGSWMSHRSRTFKTIKKGSEFPYSKAIPYDPKKLRPPGAQGEIDMPQSHHQSRKLQVIKEGSEFPYTKAITFDPTKLVASRRKSELVKSELETDQPSNIHISRKPLAMNARNSLSFSLFVPHNRKASQHHSKDQRRHSS